MVPNALHSLIGEPTGVLLHNGRILTTMRLPGMKDCILLATVESSFLLLTSL